MRNGDEILHSVAYASARQRRGSVFRHHVIHILALNRYYAASCNPRLNRRNRPLLLRGRQGDDRLSSVGTMRPGGEIIGASRSAVLAVSDGLLKNLPGQVYFYR